MVERVRVGQSQIAAELHAFVEQEVLPGLDIARRCLLAGLRRPAARSRARQPQPAGPPRGAAGGDRRLAQGPARPADRRGRLPGLPCGNRLPGAGRTGFQHRNLPYRRGDREHCRSAACRSGDERPLRAQRRQCALGQPLRRALRHGRDPGRRRRHARAGGYNPARGAKVIAWTRAFLDETAPLAAGSHSDVTAYRVEGGVLVADLPGGGSPLAEPGLFAGYRGDPDGARSRAAPP